jgi:putative ABC transport system permease protein
MWRKVWRDMWHSKRRTLLVILATAVGVFSLGMVYGTSGMMRERMSEDYQEIAPSHINYFGISRFDRQVVETVRRMPGVADAEGGTRASLRWKLAGETAWRDGTGALSARAEYEPQRMNRVSLVEGRWPTKRTLAVGRKSAQRFGIPLGSTVVVEFGRSGRRLAVVGLVHSLEDTPPVPNDDPLFFTTPETLAWMTGQEEGFQQLYVRLDSFDEERANETAELVQARLEDMGLAVFGYGVSDPQVHPAQETFDTIFLIMGVLGALSLALSGFLIINVMNATVAQQVWQIGVMKVIGATGGRVMRLYLAAALAYGLLATFLSVPLGAGAAYLLARVLLRMLNIPTGAFRVVPVAVGLQAIVGLVVPPVAALVPVIGGARITPHKAISSHGLGAGFGRSWLDRLVGRIRALPRPLALSLRNTFRRKARVALTMLTLVLGGVMFIMVLSVGTTFSNTIEGLLDDYGFDALIVLDDNYRTTRLMDIAQSVPGVHRAEVWTIQMGTLKLENGQEIEGQLWGVPSESEMFGPHIVSGRGFLPGDGRAILLNSKIAADEGYQVGDEVTLDIGERESTWTVVGLIVNINNQQRDNFVPFETLARETGNSNQGPMMMVTFDKRDPEYQRALIGELRDAFPAQRIEISELIGAAEFRQQQMVVVSIIVYLLLAMAVLAAVVGSIGLMSTMSINVVERGREIGMMRATGATSAAIAGIFVVEGVLIGALSWLIAAPLSYPGAQAFSVLVGSTFQLPLDFSFPVGGILLWLGIVGALSALSSLWPALRATRVSVREALAYE